MALNLNDVGSQIAIIAGGKYDGKVVCVTADEEDDNDNDNDTGLFKSFTSMKLSNDAKFAVYPDTKLDRQIGYITGASGAGKSTFVKNYVDHYHKLYPRNPIYLISRKDEDKSIDSPLIKRLKLDESFYTDPLTYEDFANSLVITDDVDTIKKPKELKDAITHLVDEILQVGRQKRVSMLVTSHQATDRAETKCIIGEAQFVTVFLKSSSTYTYFLKQYLGFNQKEIRKMKNIKGRSVTINRQYPNTIIGEKEVMLATELDDLD